MCMVCSQISVPVCVGPTCANIASNISQTINTSVIASSPFIGGAVYWISEKVRAKRKARNEKS